MRIIWELLRILALLFAFHFSGDGSAADLFPCFSLEATQLVHQDDSLRNISAEWQQDVNTNGYTVLPKFDALRLLNYSDSEFQSRDAGFDSLARLGPRTWDDWRSAATWVHAHSKTADVSVNVLQQIHKLALKHHYYIGYNMRRIKLDADSGKISQNEYFILARRILSEGERIEYSGNSSASLHGKFRNESLEEFRHEGESLDNLGLKYLTEFEFERMRQNKFFTLDPQRPTQHVDGRVYATFDYVPTKDVSKLTDKVISKARNALAKNPTKVEVVQIVAELYHALISIHPFIDGNGRSIRLFCDLILMKYDLPPPSRGSENDFEMTVEETTAQYTQGMAEYILLRRGRK